MGSRHFLDSRDQRAVRKLDQVRLMAQCPHNTTRALNVSQPFPDLVEGVGSHQTLFRHVLDEILIVIRRSAVAGKEAVVRISGWRQGREPMTVICVELRMAILVRCAHA